MGLHAARANLARLVWRVTKTLSQAAAIQGEKRIFTRNGNPARECATYYTKEGKRQK
jgi:hypothetical protein